MSWNMFRDYTRDPNHVLEYQYPLNLLCDVFDLNTHGGRHIDNIFNAITKYATIDKLNDVMKYLSNLQKRCIRMYYEERLSIEEIMEKLNRSENRVRVHINDAVRCLSGYPYRKRMLLEGIHPITNVEQLNMSDEIKQILISEGITNPFAFNNLSMEDIRKIPGMDDEKIWKLLRALDILLIFEFGEKTERRFYGMNRPLDKIDILYLNLDTETRRLLRQAGVNNIKNLVYHSEAWVRRIPGMNGECVDKLVSNLKDKTGLSFSMDDNDYSNPLEDIAVLELGTRVNNILIKNNIHTIGQLSYLGWVAVMDIYGIGYNRSTIIFDKLHEYKNKFKKGD